MYSCCHIRTYLRKLVGGPLGKRLIEKHNLLDTVSTDDDSLLVEDEKKHERHTNMYPAAVFQLILAIGLGTIFSMFLTQTGLTFPILYWCHACRCTYEKHLRIHKHYYYSHG